MAALCSLGPITPPPPGTPSLIKVSHRKIPIETCGPLCVDVTDPGGWLVAVNGHVFLVILPVMSAHLCFIKLVSEDFPLHCLCGIFWSCCSHDRQGCNGSWRWRWQVCCQMLKWGLVREWERWRGGWWAVEIDRGGLKQWSRWYFMHWNGAQWHPHRGV